jgi:methyl-accepting chemotaxis protein
MKIRTRLLVGVSALLILMVGAGAFSVNGNIKTQAAYQDVIENGEAVRYDLKSIQYRLAGISNDERGYLLTGDSSFAKEMQSKEADIKKFISEIKKRNISDTERQAIEQVENVINDYISTSERMLNVYASGNKAEAEKIHMNDERNIRKERLDPAVDAMIKLNEELNQKALSTIKDQTSKTNILLILSAVLSVIVGTVVGFLFLRSIKPLALVNQQLKEIAEGEGNLSQEIEVHTKDEIGELAESFNKMVKNLRSIIAHKIDTVTQVVASSEELTASAEQTTKVTEQIANVTQQVSVGAEEQLKSVHEVATTIKQMSAGIQQIGTNSEEVTKLSNNAAQASENGVQAINEVLSQMDGINLTVQQAAVIIENLGSRSQEIGKIVELINEIANQTNLLALNAAIEAARAGEMGRGFAVVANEVRKLAEQSASSAQQIAELIGIIQEEMKDAVASMDQATEKVKEGLAKTRLVDEVFSVINDAVSNVTHKVQEVSSAVQQMAVGSQQIVEAIETVRKAAEEGASASQQTSAACQEQLATMEEISSQAHSLTKLAGNLQMAVSKFKL